MKKHTLLIGILDLVKLLINKIIPLSILFFLGSCGPAPQADRDAVFAKYFEPQQNLLGYLDVLDMPKQIRRGLEAYSMAEYARAQQYFEAFLAQEPEHNAATFFLAMIYMKQARLEEAAANLQRLLQARQSLYYEYAEWYMALLYLKRGDLVAVRNLLGHIEQRAWHYYYQEAIALQLELQRLESEPPANR